MVRGYVSEAVTPPVAYVTVTTAAPGVVGVKTVVAEVVSEKPPPPSPAMDHSRTAAPSPGRGAAVSVAVSPTETWFGASVMSTPRIVTARVSHTYTPAVA
jgi:hypothetical protein